MLSNSIVFPILLALTILVLSLTASLQVVAGSVNVGQLLLDCINSTQTSPCSPVTSDAKDILRSKDESPKSITSNRRHKNDINEVCADGLRIVHDQSRSTIICSPKELPLSEDEVNISPIKVSISIKDNKKRIGLGSSLTLECRVDPTTVKSVDMEFRLRWMRSVAGSSGSNQSIMSTDFGVPELDNYTAAVTTKLYTVQRDGGLDLELNNFQASDIGSYFCQAMSWKSTTNATILSEARLYLDVTFRNDETVEDLNEHYSSENLSGLLPSLTVLPEFFEATPGSTVQLVCLTSAQDPDPEPSEIEWSFEPIDNHADLLTRTPLALDQMPYNISILGNVLVIWSMSSEHSGFYKCKYRHSEFNLTVEATGELILKENEDSAPLVFVEPELVRLPFNDSANIQCEATGYPPPELVWYRLNDFLPSMSVEKFRTNFLTEEPELEIVKLNYPDSSLYCRLNKCSAWPTYKPTSVSLIKLKRARVHHQGQYVCRANNKHGSNQASSVVDVEIREPPKVSVLHPTHQVIELANLSESLSSSVGSLKRANATFRCSLDAGRSSQSKLRWLRTNPSAIMTPSSIRKQNRTNSLSTDSLEAYDLTQMSSATSNVSTRFEGTRVLVLEISTSSPDDEGDYVCLAENEWGRASALAHLSIHWPGSVRIVQSSPFIAQPNSSFHLECLASGHPGPLELEWSRTDRGAFFSLVSRLGPGQERAILKFDRVTTDESGEYTCIARSATFDGILKDTIMVLIEETLSGGGSSIRSGAGINRELLPRLLVRPSRVSAHLGTNVTLDCLTVSGLQPTLVEWLAPPPSGNISFDYNSNRSSLVVTSLASKTRLSQFGSRLRITNVTRQHEGVYQCRGKNRLGAELAPALLEIVDTDRSNPSNSRLEPVVPISKSKIARTGSNIELKCQVNGLAASEEQPATSWSRDGLELPEGSVQLGHNLWIRNVSERDSGMYVCSARAQEPNKLHQARVRLEVSGRALEELRARIVPSKSQVSAGDSLTLECLIVSYRNNKTNSEHNHSAQQAPSAESDQTDLERAVVWTAVESAQGGTAIAFQDNVYVQANLLIIYEIRPENAATYRCHYDELSQSVDYQLQLLSHEPQAASSAGAFSVQSHHQIRQVPLNGRLVLDCPSPSMSSVLTDQPTETYWFRGGENNRQRMDNAGSKLILDPIQVHQADLYQCQSTNMSMPHYHTLVQVILPATRFLQRPVSFATLPAIAGADYQLELELSFLPERDSGLILFSGGGGFSNRSNGDYILLGLVKGHLEFRFELGDGPTLLRSLHPLQMNHWYRALIERNRRGAVMWLDRQPAVSNSSTGKFFNLNLDSVLYVGGHQSFLAASSSANKSSTSRFRFFGYSRGFQGCIGQLRIGQQQVNIQARNRSVTLGLTECDKVECDNNRKVFCGSNGVCQAGQSMALRASGTMRTESDGNEQSIQQKQRSHGEPRCICFPGFSGERCDQPSVSTPPSALTTTTIASKLQPDTHSANDALLHNTTKTISSGAACETLNPCSHNGTLKCHSLSSSSFKCHCLLGFMGETCELTAHFPDDTSVWFNQQAYLQLRLNLNKQDNSQETSSGSSSNKVGSSSLNSMAENQNISFKLRTNSSYGLIFYTGQTYALLEDGAPLELAAQSQTSKSMVANLLARLFSSVTDYLAVALVDGHVELSFELGSGVAIIRSSERVNDSREHQIRISRSGRHAKLIIDNLHKHEGNSPGKLSALNGPADVYLGGLPHLAELTHNMYVSGFVGCVSSLEINSFGPFKLIKGDQFSQVRAARNLAPCSSWTSTGAVEQQSNHSIVSQTAATSQVSYKPYKPQTQTSDMDDPDEM